MYKSITKFIYKQDYVSNNRNKLLVKTIFFKVTIFLDFYIFFL